MSMESESKELAADEISVQTLGNTLGHHKGGEATGTTWKFILWVKNGYAFLLFIDTFLACLFFSHRSQ